MLFCKKSFDKKRDRLSVLETKSYDFSIRIVKCCQYLQQEKQEYILSKQLLRSGTAVGALIAEAQYAQSKADFINKLQIALKEANESRYWLRLMKDCSYLAEHTAHNMIDHAEQLIKMLISSINTTKEKSS